MSVWSKLFTAVRGGANEAAQAVVDTQGIRILEQEVRDAEGKLVKARTDLATLMGKEKISKGKIDALKGRYDSDLAVLDRLVAENREPELQQELAERVATIEAEAESEAGIYAEYRRTREQLESTIRTLTTKIQSVKRDVDKVKVTESVQSAQKAIMDQGKGISSTVGGAAATLARIKERQAGQQATFEASQAIEDATTGKDLDRRLAAAGVLSGPGTANSVLERARAKAALAAPKPTPALAAPAAAPEEA